MPTIINAKYYSEAGAFTSKEESRYVLRAIRVEPHPEGGAVIIATDGHTLGLFYDEQGICTEPVQVEYRPEIAKFCEAKGKTDKTACMRLMQIEDDLTIIETLSGASYDEDPMSRIVRFFEVHAQGQFPDWRMVLPIAPAESHLDFNVDYLARGASSKNAPGISVWAEKPDAQAVVRSSREDFIAIVMPMKGFTESPYPPYVRALIGRRRNSTFAQADDPSLFGELDKAESETATAKPSGNGKADTPTINVYTDRKCTQCGKTESTDSGLCLKCVGKRIEKNLGADVAKKRGRGRSATAGV